MDPRQEFINTLRDISIPSPRKIEDAFRKMMMEVKGCESWMIEAFFNTDVWRRTIWVEESDYYGHSLYPVKARKITTTDDRGTRPWEHESVDDIVINFHIEFVNLREKHWSCFYKWERANNTERVITLRISREHDASECGRCAELARPAEAPPAPGPTDEEVNACEVGVALLRGILTQRRKYSEEERGQAAEVIQRIQGILFAHRDVNPCSNCGKVPDNNITCRQPSCGLPLCKDCATGPYIVARSISEPYVCWSHAEKEYYSVYECKQYCHKNLCFHCKLPTKYPDDKYLCYTCLVWVCAKCSWYSSDDKQYHCKDGTCDLCRTCGKVPCYGNSITSELKCMCHTCYRCNGWIDFKHPRTKSKKACNCMQKYGLHPGRTKETRVNTEITFRAITKSEGNAMMIDTLAKGGQVTLMNHGVTYQGPTPGATTKQ